MTLVTKIKLGQKVRDTLTGLEGTAVGRSEYLYGCVRIAIQPEGVKDGKIADWVTVDEPQLEVVNKRAAPKATPAHGPRPDVDAGRPSVRR